MPIYEIICEDCLEPRNTVYKNTKLCRECRYLRSVAYPHRPRKCAAEGCSKQFLPRERGDTYCGEHTYESKEIIECAFCGQESNSTLDSIKVCSECARDARYRKKFIASLTNRQQDRRSRNHGNTVYEQPKVIAQANP